jgi:signal transduction histidine kinase
MRPATVVLGAVGTAALLVAVPVALATGRPGVAGWTIVGPAPFFAVGLLLALRRPDRPAGLWCLVSGAAFLANVCLGDVILPLAGDHPAAWLVVLTGQWAGFLSVVGAVGLFGWFPGGAPQRPVERQVLRVAAAAAVAIPVLYPLTHPQMSSGIYPSDDIPVVTSPWYWPPAAPAGPVIGWLDATFIAWVLAGFGMLALRYRGTSPDERRRIRFLLLGMGTTLVLFAAQWTAGSLLDDPTERVTTALLWPIILVVALGTLVIGVGYDGMFTVEDALRRSVKYRALWALIAVAYVAAAAALGMVAGRFLPAPAAVLFAAAAALLFQPVQRRLERAADRWVFGARLDGYRVLARFGAALESAPGPADLLTALAEAVRDGLSVTWVRVRLDVPPAVPPAGGAACGGDVSVGEPALVGLPGVVPPAGDATCGGGVSVRESALVGFPGVVPPAGGVACVGDASPGEPALMVPLVEGQTTLGRIECGPRRDGPLLDEDRRLLLHLAGQAATAVRNLRLTAELAARVEVIRQQADDLAASRMRIVAAQDAERRRIQRDLHDGVQQEIVVLAAKLAMARQRLRRGAPRAEDLLAEVQRDVATLLHRAREFAHAVHPPVLADQGLLEAVEAQAARLPLGVLIKADAELRGTRYPQHVETTAWYVLSEALTNVVKHADARQVQVTLEQPDGLLMVEVRDDGIGFDPDAEPGACLGLAGLADRMSIVNGTLQVESVPGRGTLLRAEIPIGRPGDA